MTVDYERMTWKDYPSKETPINAENLNHLEEGVAGLYSDLDGIPERVTQIEDDIEHIQPGIELTQEEYDELSEEEKMNGVAYFIKDAEGMVTAEDVLYDNTDSGLTATNAQDAIDELNSKQIYTATDFIHKDPKSLVSQTYYRRIVKIGNLKIAHILFTINNYCSASTDEWFDFYDIPNGYELLDTVDVEQVAYTRDSTWFITFRILSSAPSKLQALFRVKPVSGLVYCTLVWI